ITREQDPITLALEAELETRKQVQAVQTDVTYLKETMRIDGVEQFQLNDAGKKKVLDALGGKNAPAYKELSRIVFSELWRDFKKYFTVPRYSELPKIKYAEGMQYIGLWEPNASVKMEIQKLNAQSQLAFAGDE
ncbi:MAG: ORF6C domain-containing protein, partial [Kurthia sp.]